MAAVSVHEDVAALTSAAAERMTTLVEDAIATRGRAIVCLTGGGTPEDLYRALADPARPWRGRIDWSRVHLFWGDERHVPPHHADSNYGMAARALVDRVPVPAQQVHRMRGELPDAADAAREYARLLPETFDVMLLGLGEDAHIASLFPGSPLLGSDATAASDRVSAVWAPHLDAWRITLTPGAILDARAIVMLVAGAGKAEAVRAALELPDEIQRYPAHLLRRAGDRTGWLLDRAAAARLRGEPRA